MARNRMIKKEFWTSEQIMNLPIAARLLFIGMWNQADDEGILKNSPMQLKAQIFPCDMGIDLEQVRHYIQLIKAENLIIFNKKSEKEDQDLIRIRKWAQHQQINKATPTKYVFIEEEKEDSRSAPVVLPEDYHPKESKGKEKKVKEIKVKEEKVNQKEAGNKLPSVRTKKEFDIWWKLYDRDTNKKQAIAQWKKIDEKDYEAIIDHTRKYVKAVEKQFRPHGFRYLRDEGYKNEIVGNTPGLTTDLNAEKKIEQEKQRQRDEERKAREAYEADPVDADTPVSELIGRPIKQNGSVDAEDSPREGDNSNTLTGTLRANKMSEEGAFKSLGSIIGHE